MRCVFPMIVTTLVFFKPKRLHPNTFFIFLQMLSFCSLQQLEMCSNVCKWNKLLSSFVYLFMLAWRLKHIFWFIRIYIDGIGNVLVIDAIKTSNHKPLLSSTKCQQVSFWGKCRKQHKEDHSLFYITIELYVYWLW